MRKIIGIRDNPEQNMYVELKDISLHTPIFVKLKSSGKFMGVVLHDDDGWAIRTGGSYNLTGYRATRTECLQSVSSSYYEFYCEK